MLVVFRSPQLNERPPPNRVFSGGHTRCFQPLRQDLTSRKHDTLIGAQFGKSTPGPPRVSPWRLTGLKFTFLFFNEVGILALQDLHPLANVSPPVPTYLS
uniref:Uncharacterized protein n=1 Tax=Cacopsylla melanoneura TaxID=428564 RepID=A0A8D8TJE4_9HEMI